MVKRCLPYIGAVLTLLLIFYLLIFAQEELSSYAAFLSFIFLAFIMAIFFVEYEAAHISSKEVALVAVLAAIISVSRIPFAPLASIQPCTLLIIAVALVFGPLSGVMCGSLTAAVSNLFLGQGPWTPWQMVAWGLVGLVAGLIGRRFPDIGLRWIAVLGAVCSLFYGVFMDISSWIIFYNLEPEKLVAVMLAGVPFNILHAAGTVVFTFALGRPVMFYLRKFRMRFHIAYLDAPGTDASD